MRVEELRKVSLPKVIEVTLDEFMDECQKMGHKVDKCGYINQILDKVEEGKQQGKKEMIEEIPWKRTVIGPERSMPPRTEICFVTLDELEQLRKSQQ